MQAEEFGTKRILHTSAVSYRLLQNSSSERQSEGKYIFQELSPGYIKIMLISIYLFPNHCYVSQNNFQLYDLNTFHIFPLIKTSVYMWKPLSLFIGDLEALLHL